MRKKIKVYLTPGTKDKETNEIKLKAFYQHCQPWKINRPQRTICVFSFIPILSDSHTDYYRGLVIQVEIWCLDVRSGGINGERRRLDFGW